VGITKAMIHIGTSGWQYRSWKGPFYPSKLPQREWLAHYSTRFPVVEVNNSFYQLPKEDTFERWREGTPEDFVFVVKASRYITHIRRLRESRDSVDLFWSRASRLGKKLGPVLFQLPPTLKRDTGLLTEFLRILPRRVKPAFEFRQESWERDDVYEALDRAGAAWVLPDRPGWRVPLVVTADWTYIRFHQGRRTHPGYAKDKLRTWADRIAGLPTDEAWIFFNNDPLAAAPEDASTMTRLLARRGCAVATPAPDGVDTPRSARENQAQ
jgi:uncharacterized protein YecE (DUF72 family)